MRKRSKISRQFIVVNNTLKQLVTNKIQYEMTKEEVEQAILSAIKGIANMRAQRRQLLKDMKDYKELLSQYRKYLPRLKSEEDAKGKGNKR